MEDFELWLGDCLTEMDKIPDGSIDMICADLPYQKTKNSWDTIIPFEPLWKHYLRVIKNNGAIILFGQDKFSAKLMLSQEKLHRYNLIWEKTSPTGFLNANRMPLRTHEDILVFNTDIECVIEHEDILVFYKSLPTYNPQKTSGHVRKVSKTEHKKNSIKTTNYGEHDFKSYDSTERFPKSILTFATDKQKEAFHPTQKPVALLEYLILTYSNGGDRILDSTMGVGSCGVASRNTGRKFIGIEKEQKYFEIAKTRILK